MSGRNIQSGGLGNLRFAGYFAWFIGAIVAAHFVFVFIEEYNAQHRWPIAAGQVTSWEEKSRRNTGASSSPTQYFMRFTVQFDPPLDQCAPGALVSWVGGPTRCEGSLDTPEGSREAAYRWLERHPSGSPVRVHYQPFGMGLRFADESIANIYPWRELFIALVTFLVGLGIVSFARQQQKLQTDSPLQQTDASPKEDLIDLNLR